MKKTDQKLADIDAQDKASLICGWLEDKKAMDIVALDVAEICSVAEALVVCTAASARHGRGLADHVLKMAGENGFPYLGLEGQKEGHWILLDLNDVLVHILDTEFRDLYDIEGLWADGEEIQWERHE